MNKQIDCLQREYARVCAELRVLLDDRDQYDEYYRYHMDKFDEWPYQERYRTLKARQNKLLNDIHYLNHEGFNRYLPTHATQ